jgi:DNA/RNA-binding domain of Phe-tRNA-synthetase-like protein
MIDAQPHPLLEAWVLEASLPGRLGDLSSSPELLAALSAAPPEGDEAVKKAVRVLLRQGGFKPSGRNKPASEYLLKAAAGGFLKPINPVVDICNVVSRDHGLPISVVDLDRTEGRLHVGVVPEGSYVFNASGQELKLDGLLCLHDQAGPCANAVKDSQRTKTRDDTLRVLAVVWGTGELPGLAERTCRAYVDWLTALGAQVRSGPALSR